MKNFNKQPARILNTLLLSIGMVLLCNACMINVPLPTKSQSTSEAKNQAEAMQIAQDKPAQDDCTTGDALAKSMEKNLSPERDIGVSGFAFSSFTDALSIVDPTGIIGAARTGHGLYQTGKVAADASQNHDDCVTKQQDFQQKELNTDAIQQ